MNTSDAQNSGPRPVGPRLATKRVPGIRTYSQGIRHKHVSGTSIHAVFVRYSSGIHDFKTFGIRMVFDGIRLVFADASIDTVFGRIRRSSCAYSKNRQKNGIRKN
jgi:hypothetical protein